VAASGADDFEAVTGVDRLISGSGHELRAPSV
jgi:hypothetical protein